VRGFLHNNYSFFVHLWQNIDLEFEFDLQKSITNKEKHGIDFPDAQQLWSDPERIVIPARTVDEHRYLMIAYIHNEKDIYFSGRI